MGHLSSIQKLRGLAALAVVIFHFGGAAGWTWYAGAAGVDVFFVISGFVMWMVTDKPSTPGAFLTNRILRIVPLYWLATLLITVKSHPPLGDLVRSLLFIPFDGPVGRYPVLLPGWTLNLEMFFYVVFALGLLLPRRLQMLFLGGTLAALCGLGYAFQAKGAVLETYTHPLLLEFFAGVMLCGAWRRGWVRHARGWVLVTLGVLGFAVAEFFGVNGAYDPLRPLVWGVPALLVVTGFVAMEAAGVSLAAPLLERLGDASYSLYLFHGLVLSVITKLMPPSSMVFIIGVPASLLVGWLAYKLAEVPIISLLKPLAKPRPRLSDVRLQQP